MYSIGNGSLKLFRYIIYTVGGLLLDEFPFCLCLHNKRHVFGRVSYVFERDNIKDRIVKIKIKYGTVLLQVGN